MESPGEYLKRERELRGVSLARIFESTRVPMKYLSALEADDYGSLPHPTFVKGYIKSYCKCLGVDETDAVLRYEIYKREHADKPDIIKSLPEVKKTKETARQWPSLARYRNIGLIGLGFVIILTVYFVSSGGKEKVPEPKAPQAEAPAAAAQAPAPDAGAASAPADESLKAAEQLMKAQKAEPLPEPDKKATVVLPDHKAPETQAPKAVQPEKTPPPAPKKPAEPQAALAPAVKTPSAPAPAVKKAESETLRQQAPKKPVEEAIGAQAARDAQKRHTLLINATEVVWVKVSIDGGQEFDVVLREGENISWSASNGFAVVVGNAGGADLTFDGVRLAPLGATGQVVHLSLPKQPKNPAEPSQAPASQPVKTENSVPAEN